MFYGECGNKHRKSKVDQEAQIKQKVVEDPLSIRSRCSINNPHRSSEGVLIVQATRDRL